MFKKITLKLRNNLPQFYCKLSWIAILEFESVYQTIHSFIKPISDPLFT